LKKHKKGLGGQIMDRTAKISLALAAVTFFCAAGPPTARAQDTKPNILVIMGDDVGWFNIGAYHRGMMSGKTPNLDKLASQGMMFTDYYAEASCTAGRANFITGEIPTATWTLQQFREVMMHEQSYRFVLHDRDRIYSSELDSVLQAMDLKILKTPFQAPQANAFCERLIGTVRRECLDFLIPLNDGHLRSLLKEWVTHYSRGRPHASLGPGIPDLRAGQQRAKLCGHHVPIDQQVVTKAILGGLHHEYSLERRAA
jgi:Sulfatase/Integrase core domain